VAADPHPLVACVRGMRATRAGTDSSYGRLDQISSCGMAVHPEFLQLYWDSIGTFDLATGAMLALLSREGLSDPGDVDPSPATLALLTRTESLLDIYSKASLQAYMSRILAWLTERRRVLERAEFRACVLDVDATVAIADALRPVRAMIGMFLSDDPRDHPIRYRDDSGNKLGRWTR
jgi:hypothetical protein